MSLPTAATGGATVLHSLPMKPAPMPAGDGRLPAVGHLMSSRTKNRFTVRLFAVDLLEELRRDPGLISQWRQEDAADAAVGADMALESNALFVDVKT